MAVKENAPATLAAEPEKLDERDREIEALRLELRKARAQIEELEEKECRTEARAAELQSVVESLGRERGALRSEAGAMRAKVETLAVADERLRHMAQEVDQLRRENDLLNQELARFLASIGKRPPLSNNRD